MKRESFNADWTAGIAQTAFAEVVGGDDDLAVTLPHDVVRDLPRAADVPSAANTAYFPGGYFRYRKTFDVPADYEDKAVFIEFEGVYRDAVVYINGDFVAQRPYGYSRFHVRADAYLNHGGSNTIEVEARSHLDARWYTGGGIYRPVHLLVGNLVHLAVDGVQISTPDVDDDSAVMLVEATVENERRTTRTLRVETRLVDADGTTVARGVSPVTVLPGTSGTARLRILLERPLRWDVEHPYLYVAHTTVSDGDEVVDEESTTFGVRTLQLDPLHGLRVNGTAVNLRGACIHHDTGLLGTTTIDRAEERRIEILKDAGFNAVRSSHSPISRAALDACDRLGMLVMDETFDVWTKPKSSFDYSTSFPEWWERDVESMVTKDFNHPSVIMYSIGNEIFEVGSPIGSTWGRKLVEKVRELDPTRFVTNGINGLVAVSDDIPDVLTDPAAGPTDVNSLIAAMSDEINALGASQLVSMKTEESHALLDVSGMNYCDARYVPDRTDFPNRVILGSETFPGNIDRLWHLVKTNSHVLGDFTWTGWDYLGESGVGRTDYPDESYVRSGFHAAFPAITAGCGDIDITGHRLPMSYYRETVFGLRDEPYIAVHRPQFHGRPIVQTPWAWADAISSWTWDVEAGSPATVDVYTSADEVELLLDGEPVGRVPVGREKSFIARFEATYAPGTLTAVAYRAGAEAGRTSLVTAAAPHLVASPDRDVIRADDTDLVYVSIEMRDDAQTLATSSEPSVTVKVDGPGLLAGLGTGRLVTEERFGDDTCTLRDGRALAIIRPTGPGQIDVRVTSADGSTCSVVVQAVDPATANA